MESRWTRIGLRTWVVLVIVFLYFPIALIFLYAFNQSRIQSWPIGHFSLSWFTVAWHDPDVREALVLSLKAGLLATIAAMLLGSLAAFAVHRFKFFGREVVSFLLLLPIALPGIVTGIALNSFFAFNGYKLSLWTIIVGHTTFCIVIVYNNMIARLRRTSSSLLEASADLGARGWRTTRRVVVPLALPGVIAGSVFTFSLTLGDYVTPLLVGGAGSDFIGNVVYQSVGVANNIPFAAAFATVPVVIMALYLLLARRLGAFEAL
jgi:putative spermidine/putrescine transport system permease protein